MAVIKQIHSDRLLKQAIVLDFGDLQRQAHHMMESVKADAARVLAHAQAEAATLVAEAGAKVHAEGVAMGEAAGRIAGEAASKAEIIAELKPQTEELCAKWGGGG